MARMYSRKKGKSGSKKPLVEKKNTWVRLKQKECEMIISKLAKEGKPPAEIGLVLRDSYGVPDVKQILKKKITQFLEDKKLAPEIPSDLMALIRKSVIVRKHLEANHKDKTGLRGLQLTDSKIKRLVKYYKGTQKMSLDWKFDAASLRFYVE